VMPGSHFVALVLGSLAPDREFIVPVRKEAILGHTEVGQILFFPSCSSSTS
jgi:hypothetical protein